MVLMLTPGNLIIFNLQYFLGVEGGLPKCCITELKNHVQSQKSSKSSKANHFHETIFSLWLQKTNLKSHLEAEVASKFGAGNLNFSLRMMNTSWFFSMN